MKFETRALYTYNARVTREEHSSKVISSSRCRRFSGSVDRRDDSGQVTSAIKGACLGYTPKAHSHKVYTYKVHILQACILLACTL